MPTTELAEPGSVIRTPMARPIRLLYCLDNFEIGGSELNAIRTVERLDPARVHVSAACFQSDGPLRARYEAAGVPLTDFTLTNLYGLSALREGLRFARFVSAGKFDIVQSHDMYMNIFAIPWARAARTTTLACRRWWTEVPRAAHRVANRLSYRLADCVLANSPAVGAFLERDEGVPRSRIAVVPNFVDDDAFAIPDHSWVTQLHARLGVEPGSVVIGVVANLHPIKDHDLLLQAAAVLAPRWPAMRVVIVGDGTCRASLEERARNLGMRGRVIFAGRLPPIPSAHHAFDISVLTSRGEGFPNSVVEAMAAGRPVVATAVGGVPDAVVDGETGYLTPSGDPDRLVAALETLLSNPERRSAFGAAGRRVAEERFHARTVLPQLYALYEKLASKRRRGVGRSL